MTGLIWVLGWLTCLSLLTFAAFWHDKAAARRRARRVPEARLLALSALGGMAGAKLAQSLLRHKTRKQPFARNLNLILAVQIALGVVALIFALRLGSL